MGQITVTRLPIEGLCIIEPKVFIAFMAFFLVCFLSDGLIIVEPIAATAPPASIPRAIFEALDFTFYHLTKHWN